MVSAVETIAKGVPQGTVLGRILFNIYLNGLFSHDSSEEIFGFADVTEEVELTHHVKLYITL